LFRCGQERSYIHKKNNVDRKDQLKDVATQEPNSQTFVNSVKLGGFLCWRLVPRITKKRKKIEFDQLQQIRIWKWYNHHENNTVLKLLNCLQNQNYKKILQPIINSNGLNQSNNSWLVMPNFNSEQKNGSSYIRFPTG
jgi:hypothetical protein